MTAIEQQLKNLIGIMQAVENKMELEAILPALEAYRDANHPKLNLKDFVECRLPAWSELPVNVLKSGGYYDVPLERVIICFEITQDIIPTGISIGYRVW